MKDVSHLSQNMGNNFEVVQSTLLNKLVSQDLLYFQNVGQVVITAWMLLFRKGRGSGCRDNPTFILVLVCLLFVSSFVSSSLLVSLCVCFLPLLHLQNNFSMNGISYLVCLCLHLIVHIDHHHICAGWEKSKGINALEEEGQEQQKITITAATTSKGSE